MNLADAISKACSARALLVVAAVVWLAAIASVGFDGRIHFLFRSILSVFALVLLFKTLRGPAATVILSPVAALALIPFFFFSLLPAASLEWPDMVQTSPTMLATVRVYVGARGELIVLQTSAMFFTLWAGLLVYFERRPVGGKPPPLPENLAPWATVVAIVLIFGSCLYLLFIVISPTIAEFSRTGIGTQIRHAVQPLISIAVATLVYLAAARRGIHRVIAPVAAVIAVSALLTTGMAKSAVFISISCLLLYAVTARVSLRNYAGVFGLMAALLIGGMLVLQLVRAPGLVNPNTNIQQNLVRIVNSIKAKLVWRQNTTGMCFQNAVKTHFDEPARKNPFYFAFAVVPRVFWPGKPSLSRGTEFADVYCKFPREPSVSNDQSVTLVGEPIIEAGAVGLATAQAFLAVVLVAVTVVFLRNRPTGHVAMAALLPWLVDFDQNFSMYVANAAKMFLIMLPLLAILLFLDRKYGRKASAASGGQTLSPGIMR